MSRDATEEAKRWLRQAGDDLDAAQSLRGSGHHAQACFLAQPDALPGGIPGEVYGEAQASAAIATAGEVVAEVTARLA